MQKRPAMNEERASGSLDESCVHVALAERSHGFIRMRIVV
jgi:hypothetical protein